MRLHRALGAMPLAATQVSADWYQTLGSDKPSPMQHARTTPPPTTSLYLSYCRPWQSNVVRRTARTASQLDRKRNRHGSILRSERAGKCLIIGVAPLGPSCCIPVRFRAPSLTAFRSPVLQVTRSNACDWLKAWHKMLKAQMPRFCGRIGDVTNIEVLRRRLRPLRIMITHVRAVGGAKICRINDTLLHLTVIGDGICTRRVIFDLHCSPRPHVPFHESRPRVGCEKC
jgi:hypothetical protein